MLRWTCFFLLAVSGFAQFDPEDAHVDMYFPHLADGGPVKDQWQTSFVFVNPNPSLPANLVLSMFGDDGQPLALDLGGGGLSVQGYIVPPLGSVNLRSAISFPTTMTGYAFAQADLPLQATVLFTRLMNGVPQAEISAPATLPSTQYLSPATPGLGVAIVNIANSPKSFLITALDSNGVAAGTSIVNLASREHQSFDPPTAFPACLPVSQDPSKSSHLLRPPTSFWPGRSTLTAAWSPRFRRAAWRGRFPTSIGFGWFIGNSWQPRPQPWPASE